MSLGRKLRIGVLLLVLAGVALDAALTRGRVTGWEKPLRVSLYPIVADGRAVTQDYVAALRGEDFEAIARFVRREAARHGRVAESPLALTLRAPLQQRPPAPPPSPGPLGIVHWSLRLRAWSMRQEWDQPRPRSQVRLYVLYYDPAEHPRLAHSLGLTEGRIGVVHAFASRDMAATNNVVIAHELLHTLGASDKYDTASGAPRFPDGYAEPGRQPRFPQRHAELMGGRIPVSATEARIPPSLDEVRVGPGTAREIGWTRT